MVSLYEILEVSPTATKDEIKKAYKLMALKTHPDRVPPEQKSRAETAFQKVNAAYEVLSNETARQEYDLTGRIPPNAALGSGSPAPSNASSTSSRGQAPPFFTPFPSQPFGFGPESFFNDHFDRFGSPFNHPFFNSTFPGSWDPFANDPFFNPRATRRSSHRSADASNQHLFREVEDMLQDFVRQTPSSAFGGRMHGNSLFDPPPFPSFFRPMAQTTQHRSLPQAQSSSGRRSESSSFFSTSSSTFKNGRWVSESYEESNVNGERKARRGWTGEDGVQHLEERRSDGSTRHLRNGLEQRGVLPPPPPSHAAEPLIRDIPSSRRRRE